MTGAPDWSERGRELGTTLDDRHAIVVVGADASDTSEVALGIARVQAQHRRVAVGDLFGDAPPLQALLTSDDPHGIVDSFLFGVSLNRIAQQVPDAGELFVMPTGTSPIDYEELFAHARWRRLAAGFREVGALLVLVAPADAARLTDLVESTDGAVIVGDAVPGTLPVAQSIAWLRPKRSGATTDAQARRPSVLQTAHAPQGRRRNRLLAGASGVLLAASLTALVLWFMQRPLSRSDRTQRSMTATSPGLARATGGTLAVDPTATPARDSASGLAATFPGTMPVASDSFPVLLPANPADSAAAAGFAVRLEQTNTKSGAILDLGDRFKSVPAGTYGYDVRTRFFLLVAGAYPTRAGAESLLTQLRTRKLLAPGIGSVTSLPFAFLVQADVPAADVALRLARFQARAQPVYALRQLTGTAHLYFGAYESAQQAALAVPSVREAGITPTLVYRIGRVF